MATIGLDMLHFSKITEDENGEETYGTPEKLAKAISADLSVELVEAILYADDGIAEIVKEFGNGTLSLGIDDIGSAVASTLTGSTIDSNGVVISASEDGGEPVAIGFRAKKSNGKYKYFCLMKQYLMMIWLLKAGLRFSKRNSKLSCKPILKCMKNIRENTLIS